MSIAVEIITPERLVKQVQADSVVVPAIDGELGILPHHTPLVAQMKSGEIRLRSGDALELFAVSGGFIEVQNNTVRVFAETAEMAEEINLERARQAAERAKEVLKASRHEVDLAQAEAALRRALVRLHVAENLRRKSQFQRPV